MLLGQNLQQAERSANFDNVGPVIDSDARDMLAAHAVRMAREGALLARVDLPSETENGTFFAAMAFEIESLSLLKGEVFGPMEHHSEGRQVSCYHPLDQSGA